MKHYMRWFGASIAVLLVLAITVPLLIPMEQYKEHIEDLVSSTIGYNTEIDSIHISILPVPELTISNLRITRKSEQAISDQLAGNAEELVAGIVHIPLKLGSFLQGNINIAKLQLENAIADQVLLWEFIDSLQSSNTQQAKTSEPSSFALHLIEATELKLRLVNGKVLGPYIVSFNPNLKTGVSKISVSRKDGSAHLEITKDATYIHYNLSAKAWKEPLGYPLELQSIKASSIQSGALMVFSEIDAEIFGGKITGSGQLSWISNWKIFGTFKAADILLDKATSSLDTKEILGDLDSDCKFSFSAASAKELLNNPDIKCQYQVAVFDGIISGGGHLYSNNNYSQNGWRTSGIFKSEQIDLKKILNYFDMESMAGSLNSDCRYTLFAKHVNELLKNPTVSCSYEMLNGKIYKADLAQAASIGSSDDYELGSTPFDELSGNMNLKDKYISITDLNLISRSLQVNGEIKIQEYANLSGRIDVGVKKTASIASVPLKVSGTVSEPEFRPTNDAIAGATIGTVLLGPGIGTAIGVKVSSGISKLIGLFKGKEDASNIED